MESGDEEYYYSDEDEYMNEYNGPDAAEAKSASAAQKSAAASSSSSPPSSSKTPPGSADSEARARSASMGAQKAGGEEYVVLTPETLREEQDKVVQDVADVLNVSYDVANVLLLHAKWNKERLLEEYYADSEKMCAQAGALTTASGGTARDADAAGGGKDDSSFMCTIMYMDVPFKYTLSMGCRTPEGEEHRYSTDAWQAYLCTKVEDGKDCIFARCPADGCKTTISPSMLTRVLTHPMEDPDAAAEARNKDALSRYRRFLAESFVDINRNVRWCPGGGCDCAVQASGAVKEVRCSGCGWRFCFKCGLEAHAPVSCAGLAAWDEKCMNESETANWILANTKKCPKCATRIEKNQGCNHMTCKVCRFDFCWICMANWNDHSAGTGGYYNCNKYRAGADGAASSGDATVDRAKQELDRYLHYYKRYAAHMQAGKFATEQRAKAEERMVAMQSQTSSGWIDVQFLEQAVEQLIECRRVLKNTYAFAYFLADGPQKDLFEYNQSMLESHTERLSELSEMKLDKMDRAEVINFTRVTGKFMHSLLAQVEADGIDADPGAVNAAATGQPMPASVTGASSAAAGSSSRKHKHPRR